MELVRTYSPDVYRDPGWPLFARSSATGSASAFTIECRAEELEEEDNREAVCLQHMRSILFDAELNRIGYRCFALLAHGPWQPNSASVRHRRLFKSFPPDWGISLLDQAAEIMIESDLGVRYAALFRLDFDVFFHAASIVKRSSSFAIIAARSVQPKNFARICFDTAFPENGQTRPAAIDWPYFVNVAATAGHVVLRVPDFSEGPGICLDLFVSRVCPAYERVKALFFQD